MELHNLILSHVAQLLPGLWGYPRPVNWMMVLIAVVVGVVVLRAVAKLLPALLLLALMILIFHGHLRASELPPSDPSGAPMDPPITIQDVLQADGWFGPVTINFAVDEVCYGLNCAPLKTPWNEQPMMFCSSNDCGVPSDLYPGPNPPQIVTAATPEPTALGDVFICALLCGIGWVVWHKMVRSNCATSEGAATPGQRETPDHPS